MDARDDNGLHQECDRDGFLLDPERWNWSFAEALAGRMEIGPLSATHRRVIETVRRHWFDTRALPVARIVCGELQLSDHCLTDLFGHDLRRLWMVAGLPNPGEEAKSYMQDM